MYECTKDAIPIPTPRYTEPPEGKARQDSQTRTSRDSRQLVHASWWDSTVQAETPRSLLERPDDLLRSYFLCAAASFCLVCLFLSPA